MGAGKWSLEATVMVLMTIIILGINTLLVNAL